MNRRIFLLTLSLALMLSAAAWRTFGIAQNPNVAAPTERVTTFPQPRELVGNISCATSVCHGSAGLGQPRSEATTWRALDPHARAYDALRTPQSVAMAKHLWGGKTSAHEAALCLKCHVHPDYDAKQARPNFRKEDGVGCESCHGAAQHWLTPHYRGDWQQADKLAAGFADTKSLAGRAGVCVGCHVGTPGADVNHDLIAAGHPALRFEFATYFANLPPHWDVQKDKEANADFEMRAWTVGQFVTTASALDLLAHRANPDSAKPWPELAELDCFACHHDLKAKSWRQDGKRRLGALAWNDWHHTMLPDVLAVSPASKAKAAADSFAAVRERSERDLVTPANRRDIANHANDLAAALRDAAKSQLPLASDSWLKRLTLDRPVDRNWDQATQRYLALLAVRAMQPKNADLDRLIADLRKDVTFGSDFNSPRDFVPALSPLRDRQK